jgi:hypothetical protein
MFSFSPSQGLVEHILVDTSWIMVGNYVEKKNDAWWKDRQNYQTWKKKKRKEKKRIENKSVLCVFKILCWWSLKSKEVKHWCLKMEIWCALMGYLVSKESFLLECSASFSFSIFFSFPFFYLTLTLAPLQPKSKTFWFMHCL